MELTKKQLTAALAELERELEAKRVHTQEATMEEKQIFLSEEDFRQVQQILDEPVETTKLQKLFDGESPFGKPMSFAS